MVDRVGSSSRGRSPCVPQKWVAQFAAVMTEIHNSLQQWGEQLWLAVVAAGGVAVAVDIYMVHSHSSPCGSRSMGSKVAVYVSVVVVASGHQLAGCQIAAACLGLVIPESWHQCCVRMVACPDRSHKVITVPWERGLLGAGKGQEWGNEEEGKRKKVRELCLLFGL